MGITLLVLTGTIALIGSMLFIAEYGLDAYLFKLDDLMDKVWRIDNNYYGEASDETK